MRLYQSTQVSLKKGPHNRRDRHPCRMVPPRQVIENQQQEDNDLVKPVKLPNPILASPQSRALHQELLFCHRRGVLPRRKPELQCVLELKQREQHKQREVALNSLSELELKLRTRQQRIQFYELEEKRRIDSVKNLPEFLRVRQTLKRIPKSVQ